MALREYSAQNGSKGFDDQNYGNGGMGREIGLPACSGNFVWLNVEMMVKNNAVLGQFNGYRRRVQPDRDRLV